MLKQILLAGLTVTGLFAQVETADKRLRHAQEAFGDVMGIPDKGIPRDLFDKAQCVVVVPDLLKGAFMVGGKYGRGYASCRHGDSWSSPAAVRIEGGSFGLQLGGSSTDLLMLVMNRRGMDRLLSDKFTLGAEAAAAAGPVGRDASANTDLVLKAEILTWSRSRGAFAGLSLEGATLRPDSSENRKLYGREISNRDILESGVATPRGAKAFVAELDRFSHAGSGREVAESLSKPGGRVTLGENRIHFATNKSAVPADADAVLASIVDTLKQNPTWKIRIEGYTDNVGSKHANMKLSRERAESVMHWLIDHGIDKDRLSAKGYGESKAIGSNRTEAGRAQNRRVELVRTDTFVTKG